MYLSYTWTAIAKTTFYLMQNDNIQNVQHFEPHLKRVMCISVKKLKNHHFFGFKKF